MDISSIEMRHFREALKKVRPAIDEHTMQYYEQIKQKFTGGRPAEPDDAHKLSVSAGHKKPFI